MKNWNKITFFHTLGRDHECVIFFLLLHLMEIDLKVERFFSFLFFGIASTIEWSTILFVSARRGRMVPARGRATHLFGRHQAALSVAAIIRLSLKIHIYGPDLKFYKLKNFTNGKFVKFPKEWKSQISFLTYFWRTY